MKTWLSVPGITVAEYNILKAECEEICATSSLNLQSMFDGMQVWVVLYLYRHARPPSDAKSLKINNCAVKSCGSWVSLKTRRKKWALYAGDLFSELDNDSHGR